MSFMVLKSGHVTTDGVYVIVPVCLIIYFIANLSMHMHLVFVEMNI